MTRDLLNADFQEDMYMDQFISSIWLCTEVELSDTLLGMNQNVFPCEIHDLSSELSVCMNSQYRLYESLYRQKMKLFNCEMIKPNQLIRFFCDYITMKLFDHCSTKRKRLPSKTLESLI